VNRNNSSLLHILATTSTVTINIIITGLIAHTAAKIDTAEYYEIALKAAHADPNKDIQNDIRINHIVTQPTGWVVAAIRWYSIVVGS
jgi:hypothetical protein